VAQRKLNAQRLNQRREENPFEFAIHGFLRRGGQTAVEMRRLGFTEKAEEVARAMKKLKVMDKGVLAYRLASDPKTHRYFPEWIRPHLSEICAEAVSA
jgi:hypothetical protein